VGAQQTEVTDIPAHVDHDRRNAGLEVTKVGAVEQLLTDDLGVPLVMPDGNLEAGPGGQDRLGVVVNGGRVTEVPPVLEGTNRTNDPTNPLRETAWRSSDTHPYIMPHGK
jgi:hypothetical protein